jgi:hypothetical protein
MTGLPDHNFPAFNKAADQLRAAGYEVFNPADRGVLDGWVWADYLRDDLGLLLKCDGVALLTGWRDSKGANLEHHVAQALGMPREHVQSWLTAAPRILRFGSRKDGHVRT